MESEPETINKLDSGGFKMNVNHGDSNVITRKYIDSLLVELRQLDCRRSPDTNFELFGESFKTPIMSSAFSHLDGHHPEGYVEYARGFLAADALLWYGYGEDKELEDIVETGAKVVKIIKPFKDQDEIFRKIKHAEDLGVLALGIDIDHSFDRHGEDDMEGLMSGISFKALKSFVEATDLPFVIKGVLSVKDAVKCKEAGVKGIVISHHHGIMDYAVPPLMILPEIRESVGPDMKIFVDCGMNNGADAFKALALGADAVSVGRIILDDFKERGAEGVADKIDLMTKELKGYMAHTAFSDLSEIEASVIRKID